MRESPKFAFFMKMCSEKPHGSVKRWNSTGFTLAEMLLSFSLFCLLVSFVPVLVKIIFHQEPVKERFQQMEWEVFLSQLKKEVHGCDSAIVNNDRLILMKDGDQISFQKVGNQLRRQKNYQGNEIVLQNLQSIDFQITGKKVMIEAVDVYDRVKRAEIYLFAGQKDILQ